MAIKAGADLDAPTSQNGQNALHLAVTHGRGVAARMLVRAGVDASMRDAEGNTPLHTAGVLARHTVVSAIAAEVRLLAADATRIRDVIGQKARGEEPTTTSNVPDAGARDDVTPLLRRALHGLDMAAPGAMGRTPLHVAVAAGAPRTVRALLALREACEEASRGVEAPTSSLKGTLLAEDNEGATPVHIAAALGYHGCLEEMLAAASRGGCVADVLAARQRHGSGTPLHVAASAGHLPALAALLRHGGAIDAKDTDGRSPVHVAAATGRAAALRFLLERSGLPGDADPTDLASSDGLTPFHECAGAGHVAAMRVLLARSRRGITAATRRGLTPLHAAALGGHDQMVSLLFRSVPEQIMDQYLDMRTDVDGVHGLSALLCAAMRGHASTCALLAFFMGASAAATSADGRTGAQLARGCAGAQGEAAAAVLEQAAQEQAAPRWKKRAAHEPVLLASGQRVVLSEVGEPSSGPFRSATRLIQHD